MTATVAELMQWIDGQFPVGPSTFFTPLSVTGEPYVNIGYSYAIPEIPGVVVEGARRILAFDEESACWTARSAFSEYAHGKTGTLYWRTCPLLEWSPKGDRCLVYMRLLISDKPQIEKAA